MNAPFHHAVPACPTALPVVLEEIIGGAQDFALTPGRDTLVMPLSASVVAAFPGLAPTTMERGALLFVPADTCVTLSLKQRHEALIMMIDPRLRQQLNCEMDTMGCRVPETVCLMRGGVHLSALLPLLRRTAAAQRSGTALALRTLAQLLLQELAMSDHPASATAAPSVLRLRAHHLMMIDRFIEQNIESVLRIDDLAQLVGLSRYHFLRCFKQAAGISPLQYVLAKRVERARRMLADSDESIAEIAYAAGFSSQSHLNATFKRHLGMTPGAFLRAHRRPRPADRRPAAPPAAPGEFTRLAS